MAELNYKNKTQALENKLKNKSEELLGVKNEIESKNTIITELQGERF